MTDSDLLGKLAEAFRADPSRDWEGEYGPLGGAVETMLREARAAATPPQGPRNVQDARGAHSEGPAV